MIRVVHYQFYSTEIFNVIAKCVLQYKARFCDYLGFYEMKLQDFTNT